ncbi:TNT domain-containing protein [Saccharomonospora iraqiensis]|uniref:TNT domain-containing protein n=1 Tax=Saccharomonospora iraqiensis TaxID=52698 RepID=UPI00047BB815|nr:TNT domain-containing protein [Saccharomonospora iraqiensis]
MRYRVEVPDRPDALYALWDGRIFRADRSTTDGTVKLVTLEGEPPPEGFDAGSEDGPARVVPAADVPDTFAVHTYCDHDDESFRLQPSPAGGALTLRWAGTDPDTARDLGLTEMTTTVDDPDTLTALWQERHDFADDDATRSEPGSGDSGALLRAIGATLRDHLSEGRERVAARFRQVGDYSELEVRAVAEDVLVFLSPPPQLGQLFCQLRSAMYEAGTGTWFQGTFTLDADANYDFDYDTETEPDWRLGPDGRTTTASYEAELSYFPRENVPVWLAAKAGVPLDTRFRWARVVDSHAPGEKPVVNRPPVPQEEVRAVLGYLYRAPVALARPGALPDVFVPGPPNVPDAFHTDGTWVWPAAVPHYLRKYGVPPEDDLLEHIRAQNHRPPYVEPRVRATVEADVLGNPRPPRTTDDLTDPDAVTRVHRGEEPARPLRASETLRVLRTRLAEHGVAEQAYRIGGTADGAWCLHRTPDGWEVARYADGHPVEPRYFPRVHAAAEALLGALLLFPGRAWTDTSPAAGAAPPEQATDWPILPLTGEPPLTFYGGKRLLTLPGGTVLDRYGNEQGNLTHPLDTPFPETSLTVDREYERHRYRVLRPLRVLGGVTRPWGPSPGGAVAYLLPRALTHHLETGALERVS